MDIEKLMREALGGSGKAETVKCRDLSPEEMKAMLDQIAEEALARRAEEVRRNRTFDLIAKGFGYADIDDLHDSGHSLRVCRSDMTVELRKST